MCEGMTRHGIYTDVLQPLSRIIMKLHALSKSGSLASLALRAALADCFAKVASKRMHDSDVSESNHTS